MSESDDELSFASVEEASKTESADEGETRTDEAKCKETVASEQTETTSRDKSADMDVDDVAGHSKDPAGQSSGHCGQLPANTAEKMSADTSAETTEHRQNPASALNSLIDEDDNKLSWGWNSLSSWGTSVLNTAASSVTTFTSQVEEGLYQVLETVESGLLDSDNEEAPEGKTAAREPATLETSEMTDTGTGTGTITSQDMVRHADKSSEADTAEKLPDAEVQKLTGENTEVSDETEQESKDSWLSGWGIPSLTGIPTLSDVVHKTSSVVQQTVHQTTNVSKKVIGGGLDVLETIGKKTFDVIAEGDNRLKQTIEKQRENRPTLSLRLREAKEQAEARAKEEEAFFESQKSNFGAQFDECQGLVHLEALEGLYSTSESKVRGFIEMLPKDASDPLKSDLLSIKQIFDAVEQDSDDEDVSEHDFNQLVTSYFERLNLSANVQKILQCQSKRRLWLSECEKQLKEPGDGETTTSKEIHQAAIQSLAEMTSCAIEHWHRVGQQLLLGTASQTSFQNIATELSGLSKVICAEMSLQSARFVECLTQKNQDGSDTSATEFITGIYLEASNASGYIRNGLHLLLPVVQLASIKAHPLFEDNDA